MQLSSLAGTCMSKEVVMNLKNHPKHHSDLPSQKASRSMRGQKNLSFPPLMGNSSDPAESVSGHQQVMVHGELTKLTLPLKGGLTAAPDVLVPCTPLASSEVETGMPVLLCLCARPLQIASSYCSVQVGKGQSPRCA